MTTTVPEVEINSLDWDPACSLVRCRSDRPPATHSLRVACGCVDLICPPCAAAHARRAREFSRHGWVCCRCRAGFPAGLGGEFFRIEPLR